MNIAFLCGCLEPSQDGVGDYTYLLARACQAMGHTVMLISVRDRWVDAPVERSQENIRTLRFHDAMHCAQQTSRIKETLSDFDPDWVSLQFVPYSFHTRGWCWGLAPWLRSVAPQGAQWHIMFHELWIGAHEGASIKYRVDGLIQKHCIEHICKILKPKGIHTQAQVYQRLLERIHFNANQLELFSSIEPVNPVSDRPLLETLCAQGMSLSESDRDQYRIGIMFGSLHPIWPAEPFFSRCMDYQRRSGKKLIILACGHVGCGEALWSRLQQIYKEKLCLIRAPELSNAELSQIFQEADFGIAASPWSLIQKSASVATLLDHGLTVYVNRDDIHFGVGDGCGNDGCIKIFDNEPLQLDRVSHKPPQWRLKAVAHKFIQDLSSSRST